MKKVIWLLVVVIGLVLPVSADPYTVFSAAVKEGSLTSVTALYRPEFRTYQQDGDGCGAIHIAAASGHISVVKFLIGKGVDINAQGAIGTPVFYAARDGQLKMVKYLVKMGADLNAKNDSREGLLHLAAGNGHVNAVGYLLKKGLNPNSLNRGGETALDWAKQGGNQKVIKLLLKAGAKLGIGDK